MRFVMICLLLIGCGRTLTPAETAFMASLTGETLQTEDIRLITNDFVGDLPRSRPVRPRTTCREKIIPPSTAAREEIRTAGVVWFETIHLNPDFAPDDLLAGYPDQLNLPAAMFLAHELFHVWQWQNRDVTEYHPFKAAAEHQVEDPYLFEITPEKRFLAYGFEQQASLVEEFVCCRALDPSGQRTARLTAMLAQALPVKRETAADEVLIPWEGIAPDICA